MPEFAVLVPAWDERVNMELLLPPLREMLEGPGIGLEIVVGDGGSHPGMAEAGRPGGTSAFLGQLSGGDRKGTR